MSQAALVALKNVASEMFIQRHVEVVPNIKDLDSSNTLHALAARVNMDKDRTKKQLKGYLHHCRQKGPKRVEGRYGKCQRGIDEKQRAS